MRLFIAIHLFIACALAAAFFTKPGATEFDDLLETVLIERLAVEDLGEQDGDMQALALAGCKLNFSDCFTSVRSAIDVSFEDKLFYTVAEMRGVDNANCYGAFGQFWCEDAVF